MQTLRTPLSL